MTIKRTRAISGTGNTFPFEELSALCDEVEQSEGFDNAVVTVKQWRSSGTGYGEVEAGFTVEVTW